MQDNTPKAEQGNTPESNNVNMPLTRKLRLCAELWGMEACGNFEHLYTVPLLQTLGMPLSLVSLTGLVAGTSALLLLPTLGWLTDRVAAERRAAGVVFAAALLVLGMVCVVAASMVHIAFLLDSPAQNLSGFENSSARSAFSVLGDLPKDDSSNGVTASAGYDVTEALLPGGAIASELNDTPSGVPFKAVLAMIGFIVMDNVMNSTLRSFLLTCSPRCEHTLLLVLALSLASAGGLSNAALGIVDIQSLFGLNHIAGGSVTIQASVQGLVVIVFILLGLVVTILAGRRQLRANKIHVNKDGTIFQDPVVVFVNSRQPNRSERVSRIEPDTSSQSSFATGRLSTEVPREDTLLLETMRPTNKYRPCGSIGFKSQIALISISTYFATVCLLMFSMTSSDYVGKAIYGGDPEGSPGSNSLARYQMGLRTTSFGFLVYYAIYFSVSLMQPRLLVLLGYRVEFVAVHVMLAVAMSALALTARLEAFFFMCVTAGVHRACFYVIPFAITNDVMQARVCHGAAGKESVGLAMSLVTASMPLSYCTCFPWVGSLEAVTGVVAVPLWIGVTSGCLAASSFLCIGKVWSPAGTTQV